MDVTSLNFIEALPVIIDEIRRCDFVAIDTEMSGLLRDRSSNRFDLPYERYAKTVESSRGYFIMQFGLSCFTRMKNTDLNYTNRTYNFYIFPQAEEHYGDENRTYSVEAHAIQFLTKHNFDFNKLFKHGVSYLTFQEKKVLIAKLKDERKARKGCSFSDPPQLSELPRFVPKPMKNDCLNWVSKVKTLISLVQLGRREPNKGLDIVECSTNHKRRILRRVLESSNMIKNLDIQDKHDPKRGETHIYVEFIEESEKERKQNRSITAAIGFFEILEQVIANKKPVVGHNLFLDLIQIMNQFIEPLSEDYNAFKETIHSLFPYIYDTKYVAHSILEAETLTRNQSKLEDLYAQLKDGKEFPRISIEHHGEFVDENQAPHQAGYDAYMSGYCFISLCESYLRELRKKNKEKVNPVDLPALPMNEVVLEEFVNKIHLSYSHDFKCYDLGGDEIEPSREHVFYVQHPESWELDDLFQLFHQFGGIEHSKLGRSSTLCALRNPNPSNIKSVLNGSDMKSGANYTIHSYQSYVQEHKNRRGGKRKVASPVVSNEEESDDLEVGMIS